MNAGYWTSERRLNRAIRDFGNIQIDVPVALIPRIVAVGVTVRRNRERGGGGRNHDSPQKDSHGPQEPGLSLHLDRSAGQKTPACI